LGKNASESLERDRPDLESPLAIQDRTTFLGKIVVTYSGVFGIISPVESHASIAGAPFPHFSFQSAKSRVTAL
jgi:hypothetical protein